MVFKIERLIVINLEVSIDEKEKRPKARDMSGSEELK